MEKELKEIGHNIQLKGIVIHQVNKSAGTTNCNLKVAKKELEITKKENVFIGMVNKAYYKKYNPNYGIFGDDEPTFKLELQNYCNGKINFFDFTIKSVEHYKKIISRSTPATGGLVIFAHFFNSDNNFDNILVLTTNNKNGYVINETDLTISNIKNLDLSKIDVACLVNLTKWKNIEDEIDKKNKTYLSFAKGNKEISSYFMTFIDCQDKTTHTEATKRLILAIDKYSKEKGYERNIIIKKKNEIFDYCSDCLNKKNEISLSAISALFNNELPEDFAEFASKEENGVSSIISGDRAQLRKIKFTYYKDDNITISFDNELLGKSVIYDKIKKQLTFKKLPENLILELENK